jgi:hypothetical protein
MKMTLGTSMIIGGIGILIGSEFENNIYGVLSTIQSLHARQKIK